MRRNNKTLRDPYKIREETNRSSLVLLTEATFLEQISAETKITICALEHATNTVNWVLLIRVKNPRQMDNNPGF